MYDSLTQCACGSHTISPSRWYTRESKLLASARTSPGNLRARATLARNHLVHPTPRTWTLKEEDEAGEVVRSRSGRETNGPTDAGQNARYIATLSCDTQPQVILLHPPSLCPFLRVLRSHSQSGSPLTHPFATSTLLGSPVPCSFGLSLVSPRSFSLSLSLSLTLSIFSSYSVTLSGATSSWNLEGNQSSALQRTDHLPGNFHRCGGASLQKKQTLNFLCDLPSLIDWLDELFSGIINAPITSLCRFNYAHVILIATSKVIEILWVAFAAPLKKIIKWF